MRVETTARVLVMLILLLAVMFMLDAGSTRRTRERQQHLDCLVNAPDVNDC